MCMNIKQMERIQPVQCHKSKQKPWFACLNLSQVSKAVLTHTRSPSCLLQGHQPIHVLMKGFSGQRKCTPLGLQCFAEILHPQPLQKLTESRYRGAICQVQSGRYDWVCCMCAGKLSVSTRSVIILMSVCLYLMTYLPWSAASFLK